MADYQPDYNVYFEREDIDGALVGSASLRAESFAAICRAVAEVVR